MAKLKVGIIGFGRIGAEHAGWIARSDAGEIVAVCDATAERLKIAGEHPAIAGRPVRLLSTPAELLSAGDVEAVLVATPSAMHHEQVISCLQSGRHVMVEKPMAMNLAQAVEMTAAAEKAGRILSVFHNRRWDADYLQVRQLRSSGVLGKWINVESRLHQYASCVGPAAREYRPNWRNEAAFGGGGLYDWGSHFVDQLWQLMLPSRPVRVFAQLRSNVWSSDCDDFARLCIDFDDGAVALLEINCTTARPLPRWHIDGIRGTVQSPSSPDFDVSAWANLSATPAGTPVRGVPRFSGTEESRGCEGYSSHLARQSSPPPSLPQGGGERIHSSPLGEVGRGFVGLCGNIAAPPDVEAGGAGIQLPPICPPGLSETDIWRRFAAAANGDGLPAVPARSVLPTMLLLDAARQSSRQGQAVDVADQFSELLAGCDAGSRSHTTR